MTTKNNQPYWATPYRLRDRFVTLQQDETDHEWHAFTVSQDGTDRVVRWPEIAGQRTQSQALTRLDELFKARQYGLVRMVGELFDAGERVLLRRAPGEPDDAPREPLTVAGTTIDPATGFMQVMVAERTDPIPLDQVEREVEPDAATVAKIPGHDKWMTTEQKAAIGELALNHRQWYRTAHGDLLEAKAGAATAKKALEDGVTEYNRQVALGYARFWQAYEAQAAAEKAKLDAEGLFAGLEETAGLIAMMDRATATAAFAPASEGADND